MIETPAKASQIIARARSLSDLPNAKYVSHDDELDSLNDTWRDVYSKLTDSDDDYYMSTATLTLSSASLVAGTTAEFLIALPSDFYKLRYVSYQTGTSWTAMRKFPLSMKDYQPGDPYYRLQGSYLWVIWSGYSTASTSIKVGYYPPPSTVTSPDVPLEYATSYNRSVIPGLVAPCYSTLNRTFVYATTSGTILTAESADLNTVSAPVALFTESGAVSSPIYYKGTLYWIRGGNIWTKATQLAAAFTAPVQVGAIANVTVLFIVNNTIYYANATEIRSCTLTGGSDALVATVTTTSIAVIGSTVFYVDGSGALKVVSPATTLYASGISKVQSDGTYLYIVDTSKNLRKLTVTISTAVAVTADQTLRADVLYISQPVVDISLSPSRTFLGVILAEGQKVLAIDGSYDYVFTYPSNVPPELMAYQCAIDWQAKRNADSTQNRARLGEPTSPSTGATGLWERFERMLRRDEYEATRIRNAYDFGQGIR